MLIEGPKPPAPTSSSHSKDAVSSREASVNSSPPVRRPVQQPKVLEPKAALLLGHHQVPLVASPQLHITHIPDKLMPLYMHHHMQPTIKTVPKRIEKANTREDERRQQQEMFEMMKIHQRLLYTIIATIGIPVVLLVVFYIEVCLHLSVWKACVIDRGSLLYAFFSFFPPLLWAFGTTWSFSFNFPFSVMFAVISYLTSFPTWLNDLFYFFLFLILCFRDRQDSILYHLEIHLIQAHHKRLLIKVNNLLITWVSA